MVDPSNTGKSGRSKDLKSLNSSFYLIIQFRWLEGLINVSSPLLIFCIFLINDCFSRFDYHIEENLNRKALSNFSPENAFTRDKRWIEHLPVCTSILRCCYYLDMAVNHQWTHPAPPRKHAKQKGARHDNKRESHLWNVLIIWVVQRKTICLITSNWSGLTVKASACRPVNCTVSWCLGRGEE